jgi:hypothetical protein
MRAANRFALNTAPRRCQRSNQRYDTEHPGPVPACLLSPLSPPAACPPSFQSVPLPVALSVGIL